MILSRRVRAGVGLLVAALALLGTGRTVQAQSGVGHVDPAGGGSSALRGGPAALYGNPAHLTAGPTGGGVALQLLRVEASSGGDLFQFEPYSDLFVRGDRPRLPDAEETAILDRWFGAEMRRTTTVVEATPFALTYRAPGGQWAVGGGVRGRVVQRTAMDKGALDLLLRGTDPARTVPVNGQTRLYSLLDLTGAVSVRISSWSLGVAPRLLLGTGYADGRLRSEVTIGEEALTHHLDYRARAAGTLSTGLYDTFDAFSATPVRRVFGASRGVVGVGGGLDAGLSYALRPSLHLSARLEGLGVVRWTDAAQTVRPARRTVRFEGLSLDLRRLEKEFGGDLGAYIEHRVDSLARAAYRDVERTRAPFRTVLPATLHAGATWAPGPAVLTGGVSADLVDPARAGPGPLAVHAGGELALGPIPVRGGVRLGTRQAMTVFGGLGLELGGYRLDLGGRLTPDTSLLGAGGRYAVALSLGTVRTGYDASRCGASR